MFRGHGDIIKLYSKSNIRLTNINEYNFAIF